MSIADHVSIPSTLAGLAGDALPRESQAEARDRRLREQGVQLATCPTCGGRATREEVTVTRPGEAPVVRVVLRCRGVPYGGDQGGGRCPVWTGGLDQVPEATSGLEAEPGAPPRTERTCEACGVAISGDRRGDRRRRFCPACAQERLRAQWAANNARKKARSGRRKWEVDEGFLAPPATRAEARQEETMDVTCTEEAPGGVPDFLGDSLPEPGRRCLDCGADLHPIASPRQLRCWDCSRRRRLEADREGRARRRGGPRPSVVACEDCGAEVPVHPTCGSVRRFCDACRTTRRAAYYRSRLPEAVPGSACPCGCGGTPRPGRTYASPGCWARQQARERGGWGAAGQGRTVLEPRLCACGCGVEFQPRRDSHRYATRACVRRVGSRAGAEARWGPMTRHELAAAPPEVRDAYLAEVAERAAPDYAQPDPQAMDLVDLAPDALVEALAPEPRDPDPPPPPQMPPATAPEAPAMDLQEQVARLTAERDAAEDALRDLCSWAGCGLPDRVDDSSALAARIREGLGDLIAVERSRAVEQARTVDARRGEPALEPWLLTPRPLVDLAALLVDLVPGDATDAEVRLAVDLALAERARAARGRCA